MQEYEFVPKSEYQPVRKEIERIILKAQRLLRQSGFVEEKITFQFKLIGSGKHHLITRVKGGNKGFDLDYNLILQSEPGYHWEAKYAREALWKAVQQAIKGTGFTKIENSTSAITIKAIDKKKSRISYSCDFGIVYYDDDGTLCYLYAKKSGDRITYEWRKRKSASNLDKKLEELKEYWPNDYWEYIKAEYLDLKKKNSAQESSLPKHSFQLYSEAVHNVYNWMRQDRSKQEEKNAVYPRLFPRLWGYADGIKISFGKRPQR